MLRKSSTNRSLYTQHSVASFEGTQIKSIIVPTYQCAMSTLIYNNSAELELTKTTFRIFETRIQKSDLALSTKVWCLSSSSFVLNSLSNQNLSFNRWRRRRGQMKWKQIRFPILQAIELWRHWDLIMKYRVCQWFRLNEARSFFWVTFEVSSMFWGIRDSRKNWLQPKTKPPSKLSLSKSLIHTVEWRTTFWGNRVLIL